MFMNTYDITDAAIRFREHPTLGPATQTLMALRDAVDGCSDGWAYWPKPSRAAKGLMSIIDLASSKYWKAEGYEVTPAMVRKAYVPIKSFRTRTGIAFSISEV